MSKEKVVENLLSRRVVEVLPDKEGLKTLLLSKKIKVYFGIDPTSPYLHLGHSVPLRKLKEFQDLGHKTYLLVGSFTAQIGDPSGRETERKPLSFKEVKENMKKYLLQVRKILDLKKTKVVYNHTWWEKMKLSEFFDILKNFTVARLLERDMFEKRIKANKEIWIHELLYPILQGYDSVVLKTDLEIGATDQTFNMLVGRKLEEIFLKKEKFILTTPILLGLDGRKMSKSFDNTINLLDPPFEMFGKVMKIKDDLIKDYFELCTDLDLEEIQEILKLRPRDQKLRLAFEIVKLYHGEKKAKLAEREFLKIFVKKDLPSKIPEFKVLPKEVLLIELLKKTGLASSKSEAKRLILQGGVKFNQKKISDPFFKFKPKEGDIIQVGKRKFLKLGLK